MRCAILFVLSLLAGCAAMNQMAGLGVVSEESSQFDGRKVVQVSGNYVPGVRTLIGARWESTDPDNVLIVLQDPGDAYHGVNSYTTIQTFAINLNGQIDTFNVGVPGPGFVVPLSYLGRMVEATSCKVRVVTGSGTEEGDCSIESNGGAPTAKASLKDFYQRVLAYRRANK